MIKHSFAAVSSLVLALAAFGLVGCGSDSSGGGSAAGGASAGTGGAGGSVTAGGSSGSNVTGGGTGTGGSVGTPDASAGSGGVSGGTGGSPGSGGSGGSGTGGSRDAGSSGTGGAPTVDAGSGGAAGGGGARDAGGSRDASTPTADAASNCPGTLRPGDTNASITSGGETRTFIVHVPPGFTGSSPVPVVFDFHPLGGTGAGNEGQNGQMGTGWRAKCDSVGCIAVFPNSSARAGDNSWNAGYCCTNAQANQINDVQFTRDMIRFLETNTCVDAKRIYASGGSNGGGMTYRLACEAADVIAAVAPVDFRCVTGADPLANAGQVTSANNTACTCTLPRPISVVAYDEGQDNSVVPYNGAQTPNLRTDCPPNASCVGIGFTSAMVNIQTWAAFDRCTGSATTDTNNSLCQTWSSCASNTRVTLCTVPEAGHLQAYGNAQAKVVDTAWTVFMTQSLP